MRSIETDSAYKEAYRSSADRPVSYSMWPLGAFIFALGLAVMVSLGLDWW